MTKAPELKDQPDFKVLNLTTMRASAAKVLGYKAKKRTIKGVYEEIISHLKESKVDLPYACGRCHAPIDGEMETCWACGAVLSDEKDEPEMSEEEVRNRAVSLGIDPEGKEREELILLVEEEQAKRRSRSKNSDLSGIEAERINEQVTESMPDRWRKGRVKQYTAYYDPDGKRRIAVHHRGLCLEFSVDDGFLDGFDDLAYFDAEERKRRHYGRSNYRFVGDVSKNAVEVCKRVFKKYSS